MDQTPPPISNVLPPQSGPSYNSAFQGRVATPFDSEGIRAMVEQVTRPFIAAREEVIEAKTDTKFERALRESDAKFASVRESLSKLAVDISGDNGVISQLRDLKKDSASLRTTIMGSVVAAAIAVAALVLTVQSGILSAIQVNLAAHQQNAAAPTATHPSRPSHPATRDLTTSNSIG